jgi:hypothetical protein
LILGTDRLEGILDGRFSRPSLSSGHGWSAYISSFIQDQAPNGSQLRDPALVEPGTFFISRGVPFRKGIRKHFVIDAPQETPAGCLWELQEQAGDVTTMRCSSPVLQGRPYYGERHDSFVVTLRFEELTNTGKESLTTTNSPVSPSAIRRTGYMELFRSLWGVRVTQPCSHIQKRVQKFELPPNCITVAGFGDRDYTMSSEHDRKRVLICLTAENTKSRWRTLIAIGYIETFRDIRKRDWYRRILLRYSNCCFQCTLEQVQQMTGRWFVVL